MMEKIPRLHRSRIHSGRIYRRPSIPSPSPHCRTPVPRQKPKRRKTRLRILSCSVSEPILWTVRMFVPGNEESLEINENLMFPQHQTCMDAFSPLARPRSTSATPRDAMEEAKVVVSVVVERSPGPVRAMVRLGATVEEAIQVIVQKYCREGRSPQLNRDCTASFELHYSHFSLQSLNKNDKIADTGARSFYLCTNSGNHSFAEGNESGPLAHSGNQLMPPLIFFSIVSKKLKKIQRRTKKLWKVVTCIICI